MEKKTETPTTVEEYETAKQVIEKFLTENSGEKADELVSFIVENGTKEVDEYEHIPDSNILRVTKWRYIHQSGTVEEEILYINDVKSGSYNAIRATKRRLV